MLVRPTRASQGLALRRLQPSHALAIPSRRPTASIRPIGIDRRCFTSEQPSPRPWLRKSFRNFRTGLGFLPERSLATAMDESSSTSSPSSSSGNNSNHDYDYESLSSILYNPPVAPPRPAPALWELKAHNTRAPLIVEEPPEFSNSRVKTTKTGIPGNIEEMLSILVACLEVGKLERAAMVLKRLGAMEEGLDMVNLAELHNQYLRAVLDAALAKKDPTLAETMHKWYQLEIHDKEIPQTPETIAYMLKAAIYSTKKGVRRNRLVERYMSLDPGEGGIAFIQETDILTPEDRDTITDICKTYSVLPEHDTHVLQQPRVTTLFEEALLTIDQAAEQEGEETAADAAGAVADAGERVPEVISTPQKGLGLRTLKRTLSLFGEIPEGRDIASLGHKERLEIQARLEQDCVDAAIERWREENHELAKMGRSTALSGMSLNSRLYEWHRDLELRISQELQKVHISENNKNKNKEDLDRCMYGPFLEQSQPSRLAAVTIVSTLSCLAGQGADKGVPVSTVITSIAKVTEEDIRLQKHMKDMASQGRKPSARAAARQVAKTAVKMAMRRAHRPSAEEYTLPSGDTVADLIAGAEAAKVAEAEEAAREEAETAKAAEATGAEPTEAEAAKTEAAEATEATEAPSKQEKTDETIADKASIEAAIKGEPLVDGKADWPRDRYARAERIMKLEKERKLAEQAQIEEIQKEHRHPELKAKQPQAGTSSTDNLAWPVSIKAKVGAALLSMLIETAKVTAIREDRKTGTLISQQQAAFCRMNQLKRGKRIGVLVANQTLVDLMKLEPRAEFLARHLPMVVEPQPWSEFNRGGFLAYPAPLVRVKDSRKDQQMYAEAAIARGDMTQVLRGLDVLGRTAWKVNRPVFSVMLEAWNAGESIGDIPPLHPDIPIPEEPKSSEDPDKRRQWLKAVKTAENTRSGLHSVRCFMNFQMEVARAFRDQTFYFPHNVDFRGRAYPIPPYFNHMGADNVRGLLTFAKGKELGADGLRWLQVHLSNVYGFDKASLQDRAQFAMDHLDDIRDSTSDPLGGKRWWLEAEDPWQCLAACFEFKAAMDLPDPTKYVSHLPVHQDGTCNGLQHYAALGGDSWGAKQVNLEPGDKPADVYSAVADIVKAGIAEDLKEGNPNAKALNGLIKRKVVKQTVMTNVYGVTYAGARKQVLKQLDALYPTLHKESGIQPIVLASYIATKIFKALSTMFGGAHDIQHWLGEIGSRVCRALTPDQIDRIVRGAPEQQKKTIKKRGSVSSSASTSASASASSNATTDKELMAQFRSTLVWTTPLQMPVVQPYRKATHRTIETCLQDLILSVPARDDPVNKRKQLQAFPPNFIHSLDASHMLLSALECDELGLSFAAVHDSFWTHAADVNTMNRVLRDAFVRIHSEDVVGRLLEEFQARYKGSMYLAQLHRNSDVAKQILAYRRKRRMSLRDELVVEKTRLDLLNSTNPAHVAKAYKMETPGAIYERMAKELGAENGLEVEDVSEFQLGSIPEAQAAKTKKAKTTSKTAKDKTTTHDVDTSDLGLAGLSSDADMADPAFNPEAAGHDNMAEEAEDLEDDEGETDQSMVPTFSERMQNTIARKKQSAQTVEVWLPLTFPPIPAKGDFDVHRLKDSDYFFS